MLFTLGYYLLILPTLFEIKRLLLQLLRGRLNRLLVRAVIRIGHRLGDSIDFLLPSRDWLVDDNLARDSMGHLLESLVWESPRYKFL